MLAKLSLLSLALLPSALAATYSVEVGPGGKFVFTPEFVTAASGDDVVFTFNPKNHSVTQSTFASPCSRSSGFNSGFRPVAANATAAAPTFTLRVNDTSPVWVYCAQAAGLPASHCGAGMVFAVNPGAEGSSNSFSNFKKAALAVGASLSSASGKPSTTAAYGTATIPAAPTPSVVTQTVTLGTEIWTSTYSSYPNSPGPTPVSAQGAVHKVIVGGPGKLVYDPPHVAAAPRDTIVFEFHQKNHTVTQSAFEDPCRRLNANGVTGFDSGFMPVADNATVFPTWNFTVKGTEPIWAYCRQVSHCGQGMVFAINSDESSDRNFQAFQDLAKKLNGTSTATSTTSSAVQIKIGGAALVVVLATFLGATM